MREEGRKGKWVTCHWQHTVVGKSAMGGVERSSDGDEG